MKEHIQGIHTDEQASIRGEYWKVDIAPHIERGSKMIQDVSRALRTGDARLLRTLKNAGIIVGDVEYAQNIIPTTGRNVLARLLAGDVTYSGEIDYGALGTQASPSFTNSSTQLGNEVYRSQADSQAFDDNVTYIDWFIASGDVADQTFTEFGAFIDGTASADSGQAFSLLATGGWVKSGSMFISARYTIV